MAQTLILITDEANGTVKVQVDQSPAPLDPPTPAQFLSSLLERYLREHFKATDDDDAVT